MSVEISINSEHAYKVLIGAQWMNELRTSLSGVERALIVSSSKFPIRELNLGDTEVFYCEVPDGEDGKTLATLDEIWKILGAAGFTRSDVVVGIGGGALTDVAGCAAAMWLRGIPWIAIPTTLAGMVDASIGGKTAINAPYGKNLIGAFHSPQKVIIDTRWLETLTDRDFAAGLAEVIKCGFISDESILLDLEKSNLESLRDDALLTESLIARSVSIKGSVVSSDFKEGFQREILNYGHTFGHAIEKHLNYALRHGESVSIGMVLVAELARARGFISDDIASKHSDLLHRFSLPVTIDLSATDWDALYATMALDKKARGRQIRFVILEGIGLVTRLDDATSQELYAAYEKVLP